MLTFTYIQWRMCPHNVWFLKLHNIYAYAYATLVNCDFNAGAKGVFSGGFDIMTMQAIQATGLFLFASSSS